MNSKNYSHILFLCFLAVVTIYVFASLASSEQKEVALTWGPFLVALSALIVSINSVFVARRHNELSVLPHISIERISSTNGSDVGLYLRSDGVGPAFIVSMKAEVKNAQGKIESFNLCDTSGWVELLDFLELHSDVYEYLAVYTNTLVPKGFRDAWLTAPTDAMVRNKAEFDRFKEFMTSGCIKIHYRSIYSEDFYLNSLQ